MTSEPTTPPLDPGGSEGIQLHHPGSTSQQYKAKLTYPSTEQINTEGFAPKAKSCLSAIRELKIEVIMFLYMFSGTMRSVSSTTMIMDKVCLVHLGFSPEICANLSNLTHAKGEVEVMANNYSLGHTLIQILPSAFMAIFIGTWSDKYGRKMPIIIALIGTIIDGLGSSICAFFFYSRVEYYYIPALFTGLSGGYVSIFTVLYSYASDVSSFRNRTWKYALMEIAFGLSMPLGQVAGGWLYKYKGYVWVFMTSTAGHVLGLAWVLFVLKETRGLDNKASWMKKLVDLWSAEHVVESFKATTKKRPNRGKEQILLLILAMSVAVLNFASTMGISYLYVYHLYNWDNTTFSTVSAVFSVVGMLLLVVLVPLFRKLKLGDASMGIIGTASLMAKSIGMGLAMKSWLYFVANLTGLLAGLANLAGRSRISKVASKDDLGKVFSFLTAAESILPIMASAVVSQVFNVTLGIYPGLIYLILGGLLIVPLAVYVWISRLPTVEYEEMDNSPTAEDNVDAGRKSSQL